MRNITFDFLGQHRYGTAFTEYLRLRKAFFVDVLGWDIPHNDEVEMDQYDNPCAHYSLVLQRDRVVGGARTMATNARWGHSTYMLRDALRGIIDQIPPEAMPADIATNDVWECTRLVISDSVTGHSDRAECLSLIVGGLVDIAHRQGGVELMSLSPLPLLRALRQLGYAVSRLGEPYQSDTDGRKYAVLRMPATQSAHLYAAA
jgi:N-acyl-L-homoserine lactone synthetase